MTDKTIREKLYETIEEIRQDKINYGLSVFIIDIMNEAKENPEFHYNYGDFNELIKISMKEIEVYNKGIQEEAMDALYCFLKHYSINDDHYLSNKFAGETRDALYVLVKRFEKRFKPFIRNREIVKQLVDKAVTK